VVRAVLTNLGGLFVESDSEAFELTLNDLLVHERPGGIEYDEDERAGAGHSDDLLSLTLVLLGALDDTREVEQLELSPLVAEHSRHAGQRRELVVRSQREGSSQLGEPRATLVMRVDLPTDGKPTSPIRQSPVFCTSKPSSFAPPFFVTPSINSRFRRAIFAFRSPKWCAVALFFCVLDISSSISLILSSVDDIN
jgi:hypothetical protein